MRTFKIDIGGLVYFGIARSRCRIVIEDSSWTSIRMHWSDGESTLESYYPQSSLCYLTDEGEWENVISEEHFEKIVETLPCTN